MMPRARSLVFAVLVLVLALPAFAQESDPSPGPAEAPAAKALVMDAWPNALGAGYTTGFDFSGGLSFQRWFGRWGASITAGVLADPENGLDYDYAAFAGLQWRVFAEEFNTWFSGGLYLSALAGLHSVKEDSGDSFLAGGGAGFGVELVFARHFSQMSDFLYIADNSGRVSFGFAQSLRYRF